MKLDYPIIILLVFCQFKANSQDLIILKKPDSDTLKVRIIEINELHVKYLLWPVDTNLPVFVTDRTKLESFLFEDDYKQNQFLENNKSFVDSNFSSTTFENKIEESTRTFAIKYYPYNVIWGYSTFSFEKSINPKRSFESTLGMIGLGFNRSIFNQKGLFIKVGYKFIFKDKQKTKKKLYFHPLSGTYFKPELIGLHHIDLTDAYNQNTSGLAAMFNFGKQWVLIDRICLDYYLGLGFGAKVTNGPFSINSLSNETNLIPYGFMAFNYFNDVALVGLAAGFKVGVLLGK